MGCNKYDKVFVSDGTKEGMSLNVNDIKYMQRMFSLQDDCFEDILERRDKRLTENLAEIIIAHNKAIFEELEKQTHAILSLTKSIAMIKTKLISIERAQKRHEEEISKIWGEIAQIKELI
jgi:hypothetical protein